MSYRATISFKTVNESDLYIFLQEFKTSVQSKFGEIAEDDFLYMPSIRYEHIYKSIPESVKDEIDSKWAQASVFTYRWFYLPEHSLLGVFSVPSSVADIFDKSIYFQNSCDQDYDYDEWQGIPIFEEIAKKWETATEEEVRQRYSKPYGDTWDDECDYDYYRRSFAYDDIWEMMEQFLHDESKVVYISLFGHYESYLMHSFVKMCKKHYEEWERRC